MFEISFAAKKYYLFIRVNTAAFRGARTWGGAISPTPSTPESPPPDLCHNKSLNRQRVFQPPPPPPRVPWWVSLLRPLESVAGAFGVQAPGGVTEFFATLPG